MKVCILFENVEETQKLFNLLHGFMVFIRYEEMYQLLGQV